MFNKIILIGNLTKDPEMRYLPSGTAVSNFRLAVTTKYADKEDKLFIDIAIFGKSAESVAQYLGKGSSCLVEGRLTEEKWESNGEERRRMKVIASTVRFLGSKRGNGESTGSRGRAHEEPPEEITELEPF